MKNVAVPKYLRISKTLAGKSNSPERKQSGQNNWGTVGGVWISCSLMDPAQLESFQQCLLSAQRVLAVVGAGLSAASGLQTFRGSGGLWRNYSPIDLATPDAFQIDPGLVWQFYSVRRFQALKARPNKAHYALAELSERLGDRFLTLTQNVDGLHQRAGHNKGLLELHGSLFTLKCTSFFCDYVEENNRQHPLTPALADCEEELSKKEKKEPTNPTSSPEAAVTASLASSTISSSTSSPDFKPVKTIPEKDLPHCPKCKEGLLRPGVVWFGESLPFKVMDEADDFLMSDKIDLVLVIGTSGTVWPAIGYVETVQSRGGKVAVFNTEIDKDSLNTSWGFRGDCSKLLPIALEPLIGRGFIPRDWRKR